MSVTFGAMGSAIYSRLGTVSYTYHTNGTATTSGTLPTYDSLAPQATTPPYIVFQYGAGVDGYYFGTVANESDDYIVKVISDRGYPSAQAHGIYEQLHSALQNAPLSISGNQLIRCRRTAPIKYQDRDGYWHIGGLYRIDTYQS